MEKEKIFVTKDALLEAYKNGNADHKELLERLYGKEMFHPKSIMDRVKTFDDAVKELGEYHYLVRVFRQCKNIDTMILALMKLRIIVAALNEGWKPQFTKDEKRYYPYFHFFSQEEIEGMSKDKRANVLLLDKPIGAYAGLAYAYSDSVPSYADTYIGSRLCFRTRELAKYAGKQFIEIYYDYYIK